LLLDASLDFEFWSLEIIGNIVDDPKKPMEMVRQGWQYLLVYERKLKEIVIVVGWVKSFI